MIETICSMLRVWEWWVGASILGGFLGVVLPTPKQVLVIPVGIIAIITLFSVLNLFFGICHF